MGTEVGDIDLYKRKCYSLRLMTSYSLPPSAEANFYALDQAAASEPLSMPLRVVPPFARKIGSLAAEQGYADATVDVFGDANIQFELEGDLSAAEGQGLVIASDHSQHLEPLLVQAVMSLSNRPATQVVAMPTSLSGRLMQSTEQGKDLVIPVIPTGWSDEHTFSLRNEPRRVLRRAMHPSILNQPRANLQAINTQAMARAAQAVSAGGAVTIFPTGGNANSPEASWRSGIGQIVGDVSSEHRDTAQVAVFRAEAFSPKQVMAALLLRDMGIRPKKQTIALRAHLLGTAEDIAAERLASGGSTTARTITNTVRDGYLAHFAD
jgi:hypothetical protein